MNEGVFPGLAELFSPILGRREDELPPSLALTKENGIELLDVVKLVMACEKRFNIIIDDEEVHSFRHLEDIARYIGLRLEDGDDSLRLHDEKQRTAWYYE